MDSDLCIFAAASPGEVVAASVTASYLRPKRAVLLFYLGHSADREDTIESVPWIGSAYPWESIFFLSPDLELPDGCTGFLSKMRVRTLLQVRQRRGFVEAVENENWYKEAKACAPHRLCICFSLLAHNYVQHLLGIFPGAVRISYPHSLSALTHAAPEKFRDMILPRSLATVREIAQARGLLSMACSLGLKAVFRLRGHGTFIQPYSGTDRVFTFTDVGGLASTTKFESQQLQSVLMRISGFPQIRELLLNAFDAEEAGSACILCLSDYGQENSLFSHRAFIEANLLLISKCMNSLKVSTFYVKPHPRTAWAYYQKSLREIREATPDTTILEWPASLARIPVEIILNAVPFRATASLASCAAPPWACPQLMNYSSSMAWEVLVKSATPLGRVISGALSELLACGNAIDIDQMAPADERGGA